MTYGGPQTDWGKLDATHPPQRNKVNHFIGGALTPDDYTLDTVESPRNNNWFLVLMAARRAITFLEQQPEVDPARIGAYGAASRCWKRHFRRHSNDLISEMAISESPCRGIRIQRRACGWVLQSEPVAKGCASQL